MAFETSFRLNEPYKRNFNRKEYIEADVIATFNKDGSFQPIYVRMENQDGYRSTYEISRIISEKDSKLAGFDRSIFQVILETKECDYCLHAEIMYMHEDRKWYIRKL